MKMKSFSLDIPALEETIESLTASIENLQEIGVGVEQTGENLVSDSWEGNATVNFLDNMNNWKNGYDTFLSDVICFRDALQLEILPKAKEVNELALSLAVTLGGTIGAEGKNIISMEPEGIEELKGRCNNLVNNVYNEQNQIMYNISSLESQLYYGSPVSGGIAKNKTTIQDNQQKLQNYNNKLSEYEYQVQELENLTVEKMAECCTICGQKLNADKFKQFLAYSKENNLTEILSKNTEELTEIEKLAVQYSLQTGNTEAITEYINKKFGLEDLTSEEFNSLGDEEKRKKISKITEYIAKFMPNLSLSAPNVEIPIGIDLTLYYNLSTTIPNPQGSKVTINASAKEQKVMLQSISASLDNSSFTLGKDGSFSYSVSGSNGKTSISFGLSQNASMTEVSYKCSVTTKLEAGSITSTVGIKKSKNVRPGWETVPVEVPQVVPIPENDMKYPNGWYDSQHSFNNPLDDLGDFCNEHPVLTTTVVAAGVIALIYFTGGAALIPLAAI